MKEMADEAERIHRNLVSIYAQRFGDAMPSGQGLYKARLRAAVMPVYAYMRRSGHEEGGLELLNVATGLALEPLVGRVGSESFTREAAQAMEPAYLKRAFAAITTCMKEGPSLPTQLKPGFSEIAALVHESLGDSIGVTRYSTDAQHRLDHLVNISVSAEVTHVAKLAGAPDHPDVAKSLNSLAFLHRTQGDYAKAEPLYKRSLAILEKALGPDHPDVAMSLNNLALLYDTQGDYAKAEPLIKRSLAIWEKALGPDHPDVARGLNNLAELYKTQGDYVKAEPLYKRSLAIWEKALGPDHPDVALSLNNLAGLYRATKRPAEAEELEARAKKIRAIKR
jgi:tetratricopeptide (TPR) repeat protein